MTNQWEAYEKALANAEVYVGKYPSEDDTEKAREASDHFITASLATGEFLRGAGIDGDVINALRGLWIKAETTAFGQSEMAMMERVLKASRTRRSAE